MSDKYICMKSTHCDVSGEVMGQMGEREDEEVLQQVLLLLDTLQGYRELAIRWTNNPHSDADFLLADKLEPVISIG